MRTACTQHVHVDAYRCVGPRHARLDAEQPCVLEAATPRVLEAAAQSVRGCNARLDVEHGGAVDQVSPAEQQLVAAHAWARRVAGRVGLQPGRVGLQPGRVGLQQRRSVGVVAHAAQFDEREAERAGAVRRAAREEPRRLAAEPRGVHLGLDRLVAEAVLGRDAQRLALSGVHRAVVQPLMPRAAASAAQGCSMLTSPPLRSKTHSSHTCEKCSRPSSAWLGLVPQRTRSRASAEPASPACRGVPFF